MAGPSFNEIKSRIEFGPNDFGSSRNQHGFWSVKETLKRDGKKRRLPTFSDLRNSAITVSQSFRLHW